PVHVVERIDRDAEAADLAQATGIVAVQAHEGREIEGRAQARLALVEQEAEALVGLPRRAETGELAHRPEPAALNATVDALGKGILAGVAQIGLRVEAVEALGPVQGLHGHAADGRGRLLT